MTLLTDKQWKDLLKELKGVSNTGIGEQLRAWEKVKDEEDADAKEKVLAALSKVVQKNLKDYAKNDEARRAFNKVANGLAEESRRINEARVNTPHNAPKKTLPAIFKDKNLCAAFKDYLRKTGRGDMVKYVELYGFCMLKPKGVDAMKVARAYQNLDGDFFEGIFFPHELDDNKWGDILYRVEERLSSLHEPFMKSPEYAKACGV
jgi:hypothetical protein